MLRLAKWTFIVILVHEWETKGHDGKTAHKRMFFLRFSHVEVLRCGLQNLGKIQKELRRKGTGGKKIESSRGWKDQ